MTRLATSVFSLVALSTFAVTGAACDASPAGSGSDNEESSAADDDGNSQGSADSTESGDDDGESSGNAGDGDGDGDGDGAAGGDSQQETACGILDAGNVTELIAPMTQADANQAIMMPSETTAYKITLNVNPDGGYIGWADMLLPDWGSTQAIFAGEGFEYELFRNDEIDPLSKGPNPACPELTDERVFFAHWNDAQVKFTSDDQFEIWFMYFKAA